VLRPNPNPNPNSNPNPDSGAETVGERREWLKPIMFTGGMGSMLSMHRDKVRVRVRVRNPKP